MSGVEAVLGEFPSAGFHLKEFNVLRNSAVMSTARFSGRINFNPEYFSNAGKLAATIEAGVKSRLYPKNMSVFGAGAHEAGHIVEDWLITKYGGTAADVSSRVFPEKWVREAYIQAMKTFNSIEEFKTLPQLRESVSRNARRLNFCECLADAIADYIINTNQAALLSREIWLRIKKESF